MPATVEEVTEIIRRLAPNIDDDDVIEYVANASIDASSPEELLELCEPHLEDNASRVCAELSPLLFPPQVAAAPKRAAAKAASLGLSLGEVSAGLGVSELPEDEELEPEDAGGAAAKKKRDAAARAKKKAAAVVVKEPVEAAGGGAPPAGLVQITTSVSRYHKEAVEDEVSQGLDVDVQGLCMSVAGHELLVEAHLKLVPGLRYGFVGRNGSGKTTLLRAMADGSIPGYPNTAVTLLVAQEDVGDERDPVETVVSASLELTRALALEEVLKPCEDGEKSSATRALRTVALLKAREELRKATLYESKLTGERGRAARKLALEAEQKEKDAAALLECQDLDEGAPARAAEMLSHVREELRVLDVGSMRARADALLRGLGFSPEDLAGPTARLSGGWRMRVAIARALFARPNVLLLDEPTNHLDWTAVLWLERYLQTSEMETVALVVVSHDRAFLDNVCTKILRLYSKQLQLHNGNYTGFEQAHADDQKHRAELAAKVADKRAVVEKQVKEMEATAVKRHDDKLMKQVMSRKTKLGLDGADRGAFNRVGLEGAGGHKFKASYGGDYAAEEAMTVEAAEANVKLKLKAAAPLSFEAAMLQCREVVVGYGAEAPLIRKFDLDIRARSRIALLGVNGSGKTTLLRTLAKELEPVQGEVYQQPRVLVGFFNQHQADALPPNATGCDVLRDQNPGSAEHEIRTHLGSFGIGGQATQPIGTLSGGEKCRVALAAITFRPPHVLLLDEPTNHLDLPTVEALGQALKDFEGSVVIASHDRRLLKDVCEDFYAVELSSSAAARKPAAGAAKAKAATKAKAGAFKPGARAGGEAQRSLVKLGTLEEFVRSVRAAAK